MQTFESLHHDYKNGATPKQKLDEIYTLIEEDNKQEDKINAFNSLTKNLATDFALKGLDPTKPLSGIFVGVKDNIHIKGELTTCSSASLANYKAIFNATVVEKLQNAGAIIVGKCNMDEFAMGATGENSHFGVARNPRDRKRVTGGSSSGSAASIAAGFVTMALGSDTGGSVRLPAAYCGLVGLKPTYGSISRYGVMSMSSILDQVGPMGNNVHDCALLFNVLKGYDVNDPNSISHPGIEMNTIKNYSGKKKIGVVKQFKGNVFNEDTLARFNETVEKIKKLGHEVVELDIPNVYYAMATYFVISRVQSFSSLSMIDGIRYGVRVDGKDLSQTYENTRGKGFSKEIIKRLLIGNYFLSATEYYEKARKTQTVLLNNLNTAFSTVDLIISPTSTNVAPVIGGATMSHVEDYMVDMITSLANLTGIPALSMPMGVNSAGLPLGLQIMAPLKGEQSIFELAYTLEKEI